MIFLLHACHNESIFNDVKFMLFGVPDRSYTLNTLFD